MTPDDVTALVNWQNANNFKLVMAYNAEESVSRIADTGSDPLTAAFLANKDQFPWLNHTYSHEFLSCTKVFDTAHAHDRGDRRRERRGRPVALPQGPPPATSSG